MDSSLLFNLYLLPPYLPPTRELDCALVSQLSCTKAKDTMLPEWPHLSVRDGGGQYGLMFQSPLLPQPRFPLQLSLGSPCFSSLLLLTPPYLSNAHCEISISTAKVGRGNIQCLDYFLIHIWEERDCSLKSFFSPHLFFYQFLDHFLCHFDLLTLQTNTSALCFVM